MNKRDHSNGTSKDMGGDAPQEILLHKEEPTTAPERWSGNLREDELLRAGGMLTAAIVQRAHERRQTMAEMAKEVGVTYGYVCQLRSGDRKVTAASDTFTMGCALYLGIPHLTALAMAGKVTERDYHEMNELPAQELPRAMAYIAGDSKWGPLLTDELRRASVETQYVFVRMYEACAGKQLLPERLDLERVLGAIKEVEVLRKHRLQEVAKLRDKREAA